MQRPLVLFLWCITLISCRKLVTDAFPSIEPVPTLNAFLIEGRSIEIKLSWMQELGYEELPIIENAEIEIFRDSVSLGLCIYKGDGLYTLNHKVLANAKYECFCKVPDKATLYGSTFVPKHTAIIDINHINNGGKNEEGVIIPAIEISFPVSEHALMHEINVQIVQSSIEGEAHYLAPVQYLQFTDPLILREGLPQPVFTTEELTAKSYTTLLNYTTGVTSSSRGGGWTTELYPLVVELRTLSPEYYNYITQLYLYETGRYPDVFGDAARIHPLYSNVENGYGIFAGYSSFVSDTIYPNTIYPY